MSIVTEMLGCRHPIIQGAMGVISNPELVMEWFQVRALNTPLVEEMVTEENLPDTTAGAALEESWVKGDLTAGVLPAGQVSGLISRISSVREIIEEMVSD